MSKRTSPFGIDGGGGACNVKRLVWDDDFPIIVLWTVDVVVVVLEMVVPGTIGFVDCHLFLGTNFDGTIVMDVRGLLECPCCIIESCCGGGGGIFNTDII